MTPPGHWEEIQGQQVLADLVTGSARLRVPGGWVVREWVASRNDQGDRKVWASASASVLFVSDPGHEWSLTEDPKERKPVTLARTSSSEADRPLTAGLMEKDF